MSVLLKRIYSIYAVLLFGVTFFIMLLPFMIIIPVKKWHQYTGLLNRIWAKMFFPLSFLSVKKEIHPSIRNRGQYIFCPNHFSYLDIPTMGFTPTNFIFVGKNAMEKVPIFGYMYKKLHITVNRESLRSKHSTFMRAKEAIDEGRSLVIYPEGGVVTKKPPQMARFKNGAFKLAIEKQIPIIPVTIPYNWILLPDDERFLLKWGTMKVVYHEPIETKGMNLEDFETLKKKVFNVIQTEIDRSNEN